VTAFVLDASVARAGYFADEATPATDVLLDRLAVAGLTRSAALLQPLAVAIDGEGSDKALRELLDLARSERLTVYDAAYLDLALRLGLPLASKDVRLREAAARLGVALLGV
jgi:predicted nucleic acid-binding protein